MYFLDIAFSTTYISGRDAQMGHCNAFLHILKVHTKGKGGMVKREFQKETFKPALRKEYCDASYDGIAGGDASGRRGTLQGIAELILYDIWRRYDVLFYTGR